MTDSPLRASSTSHPAPRLHALYEAREEAPVLAVSRDEYPEIVSGSTLTVRLDLEKAGWGSVASRASMVAAEAASRSEFEDTVRIYRHDPADAPYPWNVDKWKVVDLQKDPNLQANASAASTAINENLLEFAADYLFWVPEGHPVDHPRKELPSDLILDLEM